MTINDNLSKRPRGLLSWVSWILCTAFIMALIAPHQGARAQDAKIIKTDVQIDAFDPGIKLFVREKMAEGNTRFTDENVILFLHGATAPSTCDFDLSYKDYSWPTGW
jgi:hypothetical protein